MKRHLLLFCLLILTLAGKAQLDFYGEELEFGIDSLYFSVKGNYYFRNQAGREIMPVIYFPFCKSKWEKPVDTMFVFDQSDPGHPFKVNINDTVANFSLILQPFSQKQVVIYYRQHHDGQRVCYILTSTRNWGKPLEFATYRLVTSNIIKIQKISMIPDKISDFGNMTIYSWEKKNFMPEDDFTVLFNIK